MCRSAAVSAPRSPAPSFQEGDEVYLRIALKVETIGLGEDGEPLIGVRMPTLWGGGVYFGRKPADLEHARPPPGKGETAR